MAQDIIDGINPTRMELLSLKNRTKLAVKGHGLLKEKRDALIKEFFDILDRVKGIRENAELSLKEANDALLEAQIAMGDLAVRKAALSVKESIDVEITSRSVMGVAVPVTNVKMEERSIIDRGYGFSDTTIQLDEAAKKFEESIKYLIELGEVEKTSYWVEKMCNEVFSFEDDGFPGDEDNGSMALWYVFSNIGIYPFCPGKKEFVRTKKLVKNVKILGKEFDADKFTGNKIAYEDIIK